MSKSTTYSGRVKATYAEFYDADDNKLYSLQRTDAGDKIVVKTDSPDRDCERMHVTITNTCAKLIKNKEALAYIKEYGAWVKPLAFEWSDDSKTNKKPIIGALALAALGLLAIKK